MDMLSGSVRVYDFYRNPGVKLFANNSSMSPETRRSVPPPTETIQTKPFPVRGEPEFILAFHRFDLCHPDPSFPRPVYVLRNSSGVCLLFF